MKQNKKNYFIFLVAMSIVSTQFLGCGGGTNRVDLGSKTTLQYTLNIDGKGIISATKPETVTVVVGKNTLPGALENSLRGLKVGDKKTISLDGSQAYGLVKKELFTRVPMSTLPQNIEFKEGALLNLGKLGVIRVAKVLEDKTVVLDKNHPFAGNKLIYNVKILKLE